MSVSHLPEPEPQIPLWGLFGTVIEVVTGVVGDITVGQLLESMQDMPVRDVLKELLGDPTC